MTEQAADARGEAAPEADEGVWPLLMSERTWGMWRLMIVGTVITAATWDYIIGEYVGYYLNLKPGAATLTAGCLAGMIIVFLAIVPATCKYGIDSISYSRSVFGNKGYVFAIVAQYVWLGCWINILLVFFGKAGYQLMLTTGAVGEGAEYTTTVIISLIGFVITYLVLLRGMRTVQQAATVLFIFTTIVGVWILYLLLTEHYDAIVAATPAYAAESMTYNWMVGIEIGLITMVGWWPALGGFMRLVPSARKAMPPAMISLSIPVGILGAIGIAAILALGISDPAAWMVELGGPTYGAIILVFVLAANLGTAMVMAYVIALGVRNAPGIEKIDWRIAVAIVLIPFAVFVVIDPDIFFRTWFGTFFAFFGAIWGPVCGIAIVDFMILRKQKLDIRGLFDKSEGSPYAYWGGINPAAFLAGIIGFFVYIYILDPLTYISNVPFEYLSATLPSCIVAGVAYFILSKVIVQSAGKGGYTQ